MISFKNLSPLINEENSKLYWAFALVAGSWVIALSISGIMWGIGQRISSQEYVENQPSNLPGIEFKQFKSDTAFRNFLTLNYSPSVTPEELIPKEATSSATIVSGQILIKTPLSKNLPCPIPVTAALSISCSDIHFLTNQQQVNILYTLIKPTNHHYSWVSHDQEAAPLIDNRNLYLSFSHRPTDISLSPDFFSTIGNKLVNADTVEKLISTNRLPISESAKIIEFEYILARYTDRFSDEEHLKWMNDYMSQLNMYKNLHAAQLFANTIIKVNLDNDTTTLSQVAPGESSQQLLTDSRGLVYVVSQSPDHKHNSLYSMSDTLTSIGSLTNMNNDKRISQLIIANNLGYVRSMHNDNAMDIIDLNNPQNPQFVGQLKLSSLSLIYPLEQYRILALSPKDNTTLISMIDVSQPQNPFTTSEATIKEHWSSLSQYAAEIVINPNTQTITIPTTVKTYTFTWDQNSLKLQTH